MHETTGDAATAVDEAGLTKRWTLERIAPAIAGVALALPTLLTYYPPMSDLPLHEGVVGVMLHYRDPVYFPDDLYVLNLGHPNQLFYALSWALSLLFETRWAVKIVIALSQVAIFHAGARLADHLGRSRWGVMLLAPLALGFTYYWGMVANLIGFSSLLYSLPLFDRLIASPTRRTVAQACAVLLLLFFAHESTFLMATGAIGLFTLARPFGLRGTSLRLVPVAFAASLGIANFFYLHGGPAKPVIFSSANVSASWFPVTRKLVMLPNVLFGSYDTTAQLLLLGLALVGLVTLVVSRVRYDDPYVDGTEDPVRIRRLAFRFRYEMIAAVYLLLYFTMPFNFKAVTLLHERFLGPAWAVFVVVASPRKTTPSLARFAGSVLPLAILLVSWPQFDNASRAYRALEVLLDRIPKGKTVTYCVLDRRGGSIRVFSAGTGPARAVAERGGRAALSLAVSPIAPVRIRPEYEWEEYDVRTFLYGSKSLMPAFDLQRWEYVVAQSREADTRVVMQAVLSPEATVLEESGEWILFHSNLPQVSPASAGVIPPQEFAADTVLHRIIKLGRPLADGGAPVESPGDEDLDASAP